MIRLLPTRIIVENYEIGDVPSLEKRLSVWDKNTFSYSFSAFLYDGDTKELILPRGFNLMELQKFFPMRKFMDETNNVSEQLPVNFSLKAPPKDDVQTGAISFLINESLKQKFLSLPTGRGKTYCSIHYVFKTKKRPLVFVDQENLMEQWKNAILKFTNVTDDEIFFISGKSSIAKLKKMSKSERANIKWFIAIHRTIASYIESEGTKELNDLFTLLGIGVKIYDEAHVEFKNTFFVDGITDIESIYITATPSRSDPIENTVYRRMYETVPMFRLEDDEIENYHNIIIVEYNSKPSLEDKARMKNQYGFNTNEWCKYILQEDNYILLTTIIAEILEKINKNHDRKTAMLFHTNEGIEKLFVDFEEEFPNLEIGKFNSSIKDKKKRMEEWNKDIILTTDKSFGKAIDVANLQIVIDTIPYGSEVVTKQTIGRLRKIDDKEVFYVILVDVGFDSCKKQLKQKINIYNKLAKKIFKISY